MRYPLPVLCIAFLLLLAYGLGRRCALSAKTAVGFAAAQATSFALLWLILLGAWVAGQWSLDLPLPWIAVYSLSGLIWLLISILCWRSRVQAIVQDDPPKGMWLPALGLVAASTLVALLAGIAWIIFTTASAPVDAGQITPELSYKVEAATYGFGSHGFEYTVYRSPRWFAGLHRKVAGALLINIPDSCSLDAGLASDYRRGMVIFRAGSSEDLVSLTCFNPARPDAYRAITVQVPLR